MDASAITSAAQAVHQELVRKLAEQATAPGGPAGPWRHRLTPGTA